MRIVSLVPSLTETLFALGCTASEVVGRTAWCIHPSPAVDGVPRLGGTKTPNVDRIIDLSPDLVVLEREENPLEVYERLEGAGIRTWVAHVMGVSDVAPMLRSLGATIGSADAAEALALELESALTAVTVRDRRPRTMPLIWHEPLMAVAPGRYSGDLLTRCGFDVVDPLPGAGYPEVTPARIGELGVEILLLTSEPHDFTLEEGEVIANAVESMDYARPRPVKVDGEAMTWFGSRTASAVPTWSALLDSLLLES